MASLQSSADYLSLRAAVAKACVQDAVFIGAHEVLRTRVSFIYLFLKKLKSLHSVLRARPRAGQVAGEHWGWTDGTAYDEALIATMGHGERGATTGGYTVSFGVPEAAEHGSSGGDPGCAAISVALCDGCQRQLQLAAAPSPACAPAAGVASSSQASAGDPRGVW